MKHPLKRRTLAAFALVLAAVMLVTTFAVFAQDAEPTVWDGSLATSFAGGDGSAQNPYQIATAQQLALMASLVNSGNELYETDDGLVPTVSQGTVTVYTASDRTYYLAPFNGAQYVTVAGGEVSYKLTQELEEVSVSMITIGGVVYFTMQAPADKVPQQAYKYNTETGELELLAGVEIAYRKFQSTADGKYKTHYYVVGQYASTETNHNNISASTYATGVTTVKGHKVVYVNDGGQAVESYLLNHANYFTATTTVLVTAEKDGVVYGWFPTDASRPSAVGTTDANGNKEMVYGEQNLETVSYASLSYVLTADIVLNDTTTYEEFSTIAPPNTWTPIGNETYTPFMGTFDGDGHTISGLYFKRTNTTNPKGLDVYSGLFGSLKGATVKDVTLSKGYVQAGLVLGALAGLADGCEISGIRNESVYVKAYKGRAGWNHTLQPYGGGIVGEAKGGTVIDDCHMAATVFGHNYSNTSGDGTLDIYTGGIVGKATGTASVRVRITDCTNVGVVQSLNNHDHRTQFTGGIVGNASYTDVAGCIVSATINSHVPGAGYIGGIVGHSTNSNIVSNICSATIDTNATLTTDGTAHNNRDNTWNGGIVSYATTSYIGNNVFYGKQNTDFSKSGCALKISMIASTSDTASTVAYNYYIKDAENENTILPVGANKKPKGSDNFEITAAHLNGTASAVINASGTYANTSNLVSAMNAFVLGYNGYGVTLTQGEETPVAYKTYYKIKEISVSGGANGTCTIVNEVPDMFPAGITTTGYKVGDTIAFKVDANSGYVIRKVEYAYANNTYELQPNAQGNYEFVMPDADVTINLHFVETGADVYSITYLGCEEVSAWSAYQIKAHFKGYDTVIPTPTRPNHDFAGWLVNGSTTPVMNLTLGGNAYTSNITITATWTPKTVVRVSLDAQTVVYNGAQQAFALIGADASMEGISVKYLINEKWTTKAPITAGVYNVHVFRAEDATYQSIDTICTFTIAKAESSVVIENDISKVYDNAVAANPVITTVGDGAITYHFFTADGQEIAAPKNVGAYKVTVRIAEGVNYNAKEVSATFTITKATIDTSVIGWSYTDPFTYNAGAHTVYIVGLPTDILVTYGGTYTATNAGTYTATATFTFDALNYNPVSIEPLEWTISKKALGDLDLSWVYNGAFTYDGAAKEVTITGLPADVTVKTYVSNTAINAGTYTATATFEFDAANYESASITPLVWEIKKAKLDTSALTWGDTSLPFNGKLQSVGVTGVPEGVEVLYSGHEYVVAGTYFATAIFFVDEENYEHIRSMTTVWTIEKADTVISADIVTTVPHDGAAHIPAASINHSEAELIYSLPAQSAPGSYWYILSVPETNNYNAAQLTVKLSITQSDSGLISLAIEENNKARSAKTLTDMYESISRAYVYLSLVQDKEAKAFVDAYNEVMLTVSVYNGNVQKVTTDMAAAFKQLFAPVYKLIPKNIVKELLDFIIKNFE